MRSNMLNSEFLSLLSLVKAWDFRDKSWEINPYFRKLCGKVAYINSKRHLSGNIFFLKKHTRGGGGTQNIVHACIFKNIGTIVWKNRHFNSIELNQSSGIAPKEQNCLSEVTFKHCHSVWPGLGRELHVRDHMHSLCPYCVGQCQCPEAKPCTGSPITPHPPLDNVLGTTIANSIEGFVIERVGQAFCYQQCFVKHMQQVPMGMRQQSGPRTIDVQWRNSIIWCWDKKETDIRVKVHKDLVKC